MKHSSIFALSVALLLTAGISNGQSSANHPSAGTRSSAKPLLLERNEGELRTRRPRPKPTPASQFILKADPRTNGSQHLVVGTEQIAPGASIPVHKHPTEDEIVLIHSGTAHVQLGDRERDLHAGGLVFIPSDTWIGLRNVSNELLDVTFIFSAPGFDEFQRCISVPAGHTATPMTEEDLRRCEAPGHMIYKRDDTNQATSATRPPKTVVFLCEHGAAKSVIAAAYFNKLAAERHLPFHAIARGTTPQEDLSKSAVAGLQKDGVAFPNQKPKLLSPEDAKSAVRVMSFCPVPDSLANKPVQKFDVPAPSDGYDKSRDEILKHVRDLIDQLAATPAAAAK